MTTKGKVHVCGAKAWIGSGFLDEHLYRHRPDETGEKRQGGCVVTNGPVPGVHREVLVRFNPGSLSPSTAAEVVKASLQDSEGKFNWAPHPDHGPDVAATRWQPSIDTVGRLRHVAFIVGEATFDRSTMAQETIASQRLGDAGAVEGDNVILPGFPIGGLTDQHYSGSRNYPVLRRGTVAERRRAITA